MASIRVDKTGVVATLTIDNSSKRNAISAEMWRQIPVIFGELAQDKELKVVVLRGAGEDFSAGADIAELGEILPPGSTGGIMTAAEDAIAECKLPTVAAIEGFCVGGGWELAAACDIRLCSERSTFGVTPSRLGIIYPHSGIKRLVSIVGPAIARHILYSGEIVDSAKAAEWGMVSQVYPNEGFWDSVAEFVGTLASRSQYSIRATKQIISALENGSDANAVIAEWLGLESTDRETGVQAFFDRQKPQFRWPEC